MSVGYDPDRVRALADRTHDAIAALRRIDSGDPAAADALRAVGALRRTLDDHWMPALIAVLRSDALTQWSATAPRPLIVTVPDRLDRTAARTRWSALPTDEFAAAIERFDADLSSSDPPSDALLHELATELDNRLRADPDAALEIVRSASSLPIVGLLLARTAAGTDILVAALAAMTEPSGIVAAVDLDRHRASFELVLAALLDDPAACLTALADPAVLTAIAVWDDLDADLVETLVRTGLHDAVVADPGRLVDGYGVLHELVELTNGALDRSGIHPAVALGVATSMVGYVDTLAPAIRHEGDRRVLVVDHRHDDGRGIEVDLGSYDDLADLFGAVLRDPSAGAALGTVLGAYAGDRIDRLGVDIARPPGLEPVARFADLLADATQAEQVELVMEAAAEEARRRTLAGVIGFGANVAMTAGGVGSITRSITGRAISLAADHVNSVEPDRMPDHGIGAHTYDLIVIGAIDLAVRDRRVRRDAALATIPAARWRTIRTQLDDIVAEPDTADRAAGLVRLERWIAAEVPELDRFIGEVRSAPGMDELTEARIAASVD